MNPALRLRPMLVTAALAGSLLPALILSAAPAEATPSLPSAPTVEPSGDPAADPIQGAIDAAHRSVLIVHVAGNSAQLHSTIDSADTTGVTIRHTFGAQKAFSVQVAASDEPAAITRLEAIPGVTSVESSVIRRFSVSPNDPKLNQQASYLAAVNAPTAWQSQHGSSSIKIAVIDSGIDVGHPDLASKIFSTYNAHTGGTSITDQIGHGTFVAGVAAAQTDNGIGVAGAGYDTKIIGVKIAGSDGSISVDDEVAGIRWAATHGANIINLSLGGPDWSSTERAAVEYAQSKGVLVVAAAGNDADTVKQYPAAYPGVVAVGATDTAKKTRADFSTYGSWVTLAAPGVGIVSTTPRNGSDFFTTTSGYAQGDGTSFSSPLVAGEAALLKAQNPALTVAQLRKTLVVSAHGYQNRGLGAGQVDFALALKHVPPNTSPSAVTATGTKDRIQLSATSTAPEVAFKIDSDPWLAPAKVSGGTATVSWPSWGFANGTHTVHAVNCTAYGECGSSGDSDTFSLANDAPVITSPAPGTAVTGRFTVAASHPSGGGARLLIGGHDYGFDAASPYSFAVNGSAISDADHTLQVQLCTTTGNHCAGPSSTGTPISLASLHPKVASLSPSRISPNRDRVKDTAALSFVLPDTESVVVETLNRSGTVVRYARLGVLGSGKHTWSWRGHKDDGSDLPDGTYTVAIATSHVIDGKTLRGWASRTGIVDTRAPAISRTSGNRAVFYPHKDHYKDTFTPHTTLKDSGKLTLTVRGAHGKKIRTLSAARSKGLASLTWNGRTSRGNQVAPRSYSWKYTVTDAAGNTRGSPTFHVRVSAKRLVTKTASFTKHADSSSDAGATKTSCSYVTNQSAFARGLRLVDACPSNGFEFAYARFVFTMPRAITYKRLSVQAYGLTAHRPSELTTSIRRNDGSVEVPNYVKISSSTHRWYTIASVPAAGHVTAHRHTYFELILDSYYAGPNDFDLGYARARLTYVTLR